MTPVRFDGYRQQLVLAERVRVRLSFTGRQSGETGTESTGRKAPRKASPFREVLAQLHTTRRGLHAVGFEDLFPSRRRGMPTSELRVQRQGQAVGFRVEPATGVFGPGSTLFFFADETASIDGLHEGGGVGARAIDFGPGDGPRARHAGGRIPRFAVHGLRVVRDEPDLPVGAPGGTGRVAVGGARGGEPGADGGARPLGCGHGVPAAGAAHCRPAGGIGVGDRGGAPRPGDAQRRGGGRRTLLGEEAVSAERERPRVAAPRGVEHAVAPERRRHGCLLAGVPGQGDGGLPAGGDGSPRGLRRHMGGRRRGGGGGGDRLSRGARRDGFLVARRDRRSSE